MALPRVWQAIGHALIEHLVMDDLTLCGQRPWSATTDPTVDPSGNNTEDIWYSDHEAPVVIPCGICMPGHKDEHWVNADDLMTTHTIAELVGFGDPAVSNWQKRDPTFPAPVKRFSKNSAVWIRSDVMAWFQGRFEEVMRAIEKHKDGVL